MSNSPQAKLMAVQNAAAGLQVQLEDERANFAKDTALLVQQEQVSQQYSLQLTEELQDLRRELAGTVKQLNNVEKRAEIEIAALRRELAMAREERFQMVASLRADLAAERYAREEAQDEVQKLKAIKREYLELRDEYERLATLYRSKSEQLTDQIAANIKLERIVSSLQSQLHNADAKLDIKEQENRVLKAQLNDLSNQFLHFQAVLQERDHKEREDCLRRSDYGRFYTRPDAPRRDDQEPRERRHPGQGW